MSDFTNKLVPTIGLEIHAELRTRTKMFCDSKNDPDEDRPNANICPVCLAHPGTLPVINYDAVAHVLKVGLAVGGTLAGYTEFDRKNYFYPDIPKGYQISQYKFPLVQGGTLGDVDITRIHLEEDTARSVHDQGDESLVDFNRAGVPLMELVTEPVIHSAEEAADFARNLRLLLRYVGASHANLEKGEMRVEANISVAPEGELGTKVEVKNLNSFRTVERAIAHEIKRQTEVLNRGERVVQETRGWDENTEKTFSQRMKEESHDYRYFPEPDLPKLKISEIEEFKEDQLRATMPELPESRRERLSALGLPEQTVEIFILEKELGDFYTAVAKSISERFRGNEKALKLAANYITSDLIGLAKSSNQDLEAALQLDRFNSADFAKLIELIDSGELSSRGGKDVLAIWYQKGGDPEGIARAHNLIQESGEEALVAVIEALLKEHPTVVEEYKAGKEASLQFLVGQGMKATKGSANPQILAKLLKEKIVG